LDFNLLFALWRPIEPDARRLPAFNDFVRELGLVDYWPTTGNWGCLLDSGRSLSIAL
jgi:hypothetical protein